MGSNTALFRKSVVRASSAAQDEPYTSRSELAYRRLRDAIATGKLAPGQRVMEVEVAEWLNVSRTPVREALRRLEGDGMLAIEPRTGLVVTSITREAMLELYVMREVLESTAARLCADHASEVELMALEELTKREERLERDYEARVRVNRLFHDTIHRAAHNRYLEKSLSAVNDSMCLLGKSQMLIPARAKEAQAEHAELFDAIRKRDADAAERIARKHVQSARRQRLKQLFASADQ
jgi:DNA-binding GntR family transcriptional regulator